jgi:hypothetical protein
MAAILVPGVAQSVVQGVISGTNFAMVWHWRFGTSTAAWATADLNTLSNTIFNSTKTRCQAHVPTQTTYNSCTAVDIGSPVPNVGSSTGASWIGTAPSGLGAQTCILINFNIGARYRGGHPRTYFPGVSPNDCTDGRNVASAGQTFWANAFVGIVNDVVTALPGSGGGAANHCVPLFLYTYTDVPSKHKYTKTKSALLGVQTVRSYSCNAQIASQRRRVNTL